MTGSLGSDHGNVNVSGRNDASEVDIEAMSKHQHIAGLKIGRYIPFIHICLLFIVYQDHYDISLFCSFSRGIYIKALLNGPVP